MSENESGQVDGGAESGSSEEQQSFTQEDVDRIVTDRLKRERESTRAKYADYDDLKKAAEGAKTLEDRVAELEDTSTKSTQRAMRAEIAGEFGISTKRGAKGEPSDADLFLTGTDEDTIRSQATRLSERESERKKQGNYAPSEGKTPSASAKPNDERETARKLFSSGN